MKKLTQKQYAYQIVVSKKRFDRRLQEYTKRRSRNKLRNLGHKAGAEGDEKGKRIPITAPSTLDVIHPRYKDLTCKFLQDITQKVVIEGLSIRIRFSSTVFISPSGALVLFACIDKALRLTGRSSSITMSYPENDCVESVLQITGVNRLVNAANRKTEPQLKQLVAANKLMQLQPIVTETTVNGQPAGLLLQGFQPSLTQDECKFIYGGIMEAVTNCAQHAYLTDDFDSNQLAALGKRWWLLIAKDPQHNVHIIVCDLGIGIPISFPKKFAQHWQALIAKLGNNHTTTDCFAIEEAMKYAATRTRQTNRGKGLADFKKPVDKVVGGRLHVLSNYGFYLYKNGAKSADVGGIGIDSKESLCGTLIEWVLPARDLGKATME